MPVPHARSVRRYETPWELIADNVAIQDPGVKARICVASRR
jgi:hypothetical protein